MINKINIFKVLKTKTVSRLQRYIYKRFGIPKLNQLKKDTFEYSEKSPEILSYSPPIIDGSLSTKIQDSRFYALNTEYRAYNFEGTDTKFPENYVCIDSHGDRRLKPHVYIDLVAIQPEYARKGIYSKTIKKLAQIALLEDGCEGRMILEARKVKLKCKTDIPSPSLAHWKNGFRFVDNEKNIIMQKVLAGELPLESAPEGTMYYSL